MDKITLQVNGQKIEVKPEHLSWTLVRYLRDELNLTGTKQGCSSEGTCGLCKIILNGKARTSCKLFMKELNGAVVETIENLIVNGNPPHPLLQTAIQDGIFQCGYCAPGAILSAKALLDEKPDPTDEEISRAISGVLCRCAGLNRFDRSIKRAAAILRGDEKSTWTDEDTANEYMTLEKLTGVLVYSDDLKFPDMLYAKALRANVPHGKVKKVDISKAENMPGIIRILTSKDIPGKNIFGVIVPDQPIFCDEIVRYVGDTLALVIGESNETIDAALDAIEVEIEPLPIISNVREALAADAPVLHPRLKDVYPDMPNVLKHFHISKGDISKGFEEADIILEESYKVPFVEHAYMETETSIATLEEDGVVKIYVGSQGPTDDRHQIAQALGLPEEKVQIAHMYMGGGFGGKEDIAGQIHAALAAVTTQHPVKVHWDRTESLLVSYKRHAAELDYKVGATKDGRLVAADIKVYGDTGAYASAGEAVLFRMMAFACGPYEIPHVNVDTYAVHTNNMPCGAFRGYGSPQVTFAAETHFQRIIDALKLDSIETRLKNALDLGKATITGDVLTPDVGAGMIQCLKAVQAELAKTNIPESSEEEKIGVGIACAYKNVGLGSNIPDQAGAQVILEKDGTFLVRHGAADMGQGSTQVMAVIAARILGVPLSSIKVHTGDTRFDPHGGMTTASRATFVSGNAVHLAASGLKEKLWKAVSEEFGVASDELEISDGQFINSQTKQVYISLKDLAGGDETFKCLSDYHAPTTQPAPDYVESKPKVPAAPLHFAYDFGAQAAIVAVNSKTGNVRVLKIIAAHDSGTPIIYKNVIGQIEGAAIQGLGYALSESFELEHGIPTSLKMKDLGLLRFRDIPEIIPIPITDPHPKGPFGAKGMGELALTPTAPAVVNAIHDAVGVWINELPVTKEKIVTAMQLNNRMEESNGSIKG
ncbi:MAG TPA: hypothetical protein DCK95_03865 [Anaerolineaceae bacterium]|nr:hypothetical protein [Anaerolineaceae bacterium]